MNIDIIGTSAVAVRELFKKNCLEIERGAWGHMISILQSFLKRQDYCILVFVYYEFNYKNAEPKIFV